MRRIAVLLLLLLCLAACSDYNELEELMIVTGAALDRRGEELVLTAEVLRTEEAANGTPTTTYTVTAPSLAGCAAELQRYVGGEVYWGHTELLVFSPAALESDFSETLDWVLRDNEARLTLVFAVCEGETAAELFSAETDAFSAGKTLVHMLQSGNVPKLAEDAAAFHLKNRLEGGEPVLLPLLGMAETADYRGEAETQARAVPAGAVLLLPGEEDPTVVHQAATLSSRQAQLLQLSREECGNNGCLVESSDWAVTVERARTEPGPGLTLRGDCRITRYAGGGENHLAPEEAAKVAAEAAAMLEAELTEALLAAAPALGEAPTVRVTLTTVGTGLISG